ncbi:MAG: transglycosylase SLT domain-containing protein [Xanthobacteraceae bacterium]
MLVETISAIGAAVTGAIRQAAQATGTGFSYLLATAKIESGLDPNIKSSTSSATGLFQFIEQTWLMTMKQSGAELGYGRYAGAIEKTASGRYVVSDPALRAEILNLRKDPTANAAMAGALTRHNAARLKARIGRDATEGELYMAHFLGAGGAARLIDAAANRPDASAAKLFPKAAAANRSIFYDKQGGARSVTGVYALLATKLAHALPGGAPPQVAAAAPVRSQTAAAAPGVFSPPRTAAVAPTLPMPPLAKSVAPLIFAQTAAPAAPAVPTTAASPVDTSPPLAFASDGQPGFYDLFRTEGRGGVSQAVSELWGVRSASTPQPTTAVAPGAAVVPASGVTGRDRGFDLFRSPRT